MISDYFKLSIKNIRKRRLRSWLTILGIIISIATIFVLIALSLGLQNAIQEQFRQLGTDKIFILQRGQLGAPGTGGAAQLTTADVDIIKKVSGIKDITYATVGNAKVESGDQFRYAMAIGFPLDAADIFEETGFYKPDEGRMIKKGDSGVVMLGSQYKYNNFFKKPIGAGDKITINGNQFKVLTILQTVGNPTDDKNIYMSIEDLKSTFNTGDRVDQMIAQIEPGQDIKSVASNVEKKLRKFRGLTEKTQDFSVQTPEELLSSFSTILNIITGFLFGIASISLLVGAVGIANTMFTSVIERTKEIGVMKAIGAKNSDILSIFVIESGLLGLLGGAIGILLGISIGKLVEYIAIHQLETNLLQVATPIWLILSCLAFSFLVGALSGAFPAYRASRIKPVDALRYE